MCKLVKFTLVTAYCFVILQFIASLNKQDGRDEIELNYIFREPMAMKLIEQELKSNDKREFTMVFEVPFRFKTDLKFILRYTKAFSHYDYFDHGQAIFIEQNCSYYNCFFTTNKALLGSLSNFDAILFDVENDWDTPPKIRKVFQKYIFMASESASNFPLCHKFNENYFNLTWTYKLDSDISLSYFNVFDKNGTKVGPRIDIEWVKMEPIKKDLKDILETKSKTAAWFVSHCEKESGRFQAAGRIQKELEMFGLGIDVYGTCGNLTCSRDDSDECNAMLRNTYYFYLAFENSLSEDYVTEKLMTALDNYAVPVVYGGADYNRFLPPGSYLNARGMSAKSVAYEIKKAVDNKETYYNYFRWHNHYTFRRSAGNTCELCRVLNEGAPTTRHASRAWWYPGYRERCRDKYQLEIV